MRMASASGRRASRATRVARDARASEIGPVDSTLMFIDPIFEESAELGKLSAVGPHDRAHQAATRRPSNPAGDMHADHATHQEASQWRFGNAL